MSATKIEVRDYLIEMATAGKIIYYAELYNRFEIRTGPAADTNPIPLFLGLIMREDADRHEPLLPSIVVNKNKDKPRSELLPNDQYFKTLSLIRGVDIPTKGRSKSKVQRQYFLPERDAVFAHYAQSGVLVQPPIEQADMNEICLTCQRTGRLTPLIEGYFALPPGPSPWLFICKDARRDSDKEYSFPFAAMTKSPVHLIYWLTYLHGRRSFDSEHFMTFMYILRDNIRDQLHRTDGVGLSVDGLPPDDD